MTFPERAVSIISITIPLTPKVSEHMYVNCDIAYCDCFSLVDTVDREIFAVKIIHVLNFRAFNFRRLTVPQ